MTNPYVDPNEPGFNPAYRGTPPWDIGRPQPAFVQLEEAGEIQGAVLDIGCGTGEHVVYLAERGHDAWGIDLATLAIEVARRKTAERQIDATFLVADVFDLGALGISPDGLRSAFASGWRTNYIRPAQFAINPMPVHKDRAWLASISRT